MSGEQEAVTSTPAQEAHKDSIGLFLHHLGKFQRAPEKIMTSWQQTQQAKETSLDRIFLDTGGFTAWFGLMLVERAAAIHRHFSGQAACKQLLGELRTQPASTHTVIAKRLALAIQPHIQEKVDRVYNNNICNKKKVEPSQHHESAHRSHKRRCIPGKNGHLQFNNNNPLDLTTPYSESEHSPTSGYSSEVQISGPHPFAQDTQVLVNASLADSMQLFPLLLSRGVKRIPDSRAGNLVADISMAFPTTPFQGKVGCQMAIEVMEDHVQHIARDIFDVRIETTSGLRYIWLSHGLKVLPNPKFTLQGCLCGNIVKFGPEVSVAIIASPKYQENVKQMHDWTDSVSMVISQDANEGATIYLSLGLWEGTYIKKKLYY